LSRRTGFFANNGRVADMHYSLTHLNLGAAFALGLGAIAALVQPTPVAAQTITEYQVPTLGSSPTNIAAGPDGALWFTQSSKIGRITTAGVITEFIMQSSPFAIAAGPDGALWVTESGDNRIGRITAAGLISEFTIPTGNSGPDGIAAGPDGALWFTENIANKIGRITTGVSSPNSLFRRPAAVP
jgi:streptogramin lyase